MNMDFAKKTNNKPMYLSIYILVYMNNTFCHLTEYSAIMKIKKKTSQINMCVCFNTWARLAS